LQSGYQPQTDIKIVASAGSCEMPTTAINCPTLVPKYSSPNNDAVPCATEQLDLVPVVDYLSKQCFADKLSVYPSPKPPMLADDASQPCGKKISISLSLAVPAVSLDNPVGKNSTGVATVTGIGAGTAVSSQEDTVIHIRPETEYKACPSPELHVFYREGPYKQEINGNYSSILGHRCLGLECNGEVVGIAQDEDALSQGGAPFILPSKEAPVWVCCSSEGEGVRPGQFWETTRRTHRPKTEH
jgi:hypothetical protein